jgi:hypothetical protein
MTVLHFIIDESEADQRLDSALAAVAGITRSQARRWIDADRVRVNDCSCRASQSVRLGDALDATPPELARSTLEPEAIALEILHEDEDLIVIDKPAGMVVHPAPGHASGTLVHALLHHCANLAGIGGVERPGIVHRLDRGTSGVLVAAKCDEAHRRRRRPCGASRGGFQNASGRCSTSSPKPDVRIRFGFIWLRSGCPSLATPCTGDLEVGGSNWNAQHFTQLPSVSCTPAVGNPCDSRHRFQQT